MHRPPRPGTVLFDKSMQAVYTVVVPADLVPGIIIWRGRYFAFRNGGYHEQTVWEAV